MRKTGATTTVSNDAAPDQFAGGERAFSPKVVARKLVLDAVADDPVVVSEAMVEQLMAHLQTMTLKQLGELSKRLQLRLYRDGRWVYLKDGRASSQLVRPKPKRQAKRPPCCEAARMTPTNDF